jgi:hypothetical protein
MNPDKLQEMTASQANAAFGELPYRYWGRNPTLQDALRTFLLAPDFLEARARFVGGALKPFGREQMMALGALAATQYITARIANQVMNKDAHWELKNAFKIVIGNHAYGVRTIPGDVLHLVSDPRSFTFNRISPLSRTGLEAMTGRDDRGLKRDIVEQTKDLVSMPVPISLKSRLGQKWWEYFVNSLGVQEQRYDTQQTIAQKAQDWKAKNGIKSPVDIVYNADEDKYAALKLALRDGDQEAAQAQFNKLKQTTSAAKIHKHFKESLNRPWTGSKAADAKFFSTLDDGGKQEFKNAQEAKQKELSLVMKLK